MYKRLWGTFQRKMPGRVLAISIRPSETTLQCEECKGQILLKESVSAAY